MLPKNDCTIKYTKKRNSTLLRRISQRQSWKGSLNTAEPNLIWHTKTANWLKRAAGMQRHYDPYKKGENQNNQQHNNGPIHSDDSEEGGRRGCYGNRWRGRGHSPNANDSETSANDAQKETTGTIRKGNRNFSNLVGSYIGICQVAKNWANKKRSRNH